MSRMWLAIRAFLAAALSLGIFAATSASGQDAPTQSSHPGRGAGQESDAAKSKAASDQTSRANDKTRAKADVESEFVRKTDAEWRRILSRYQYAVTRQKATEPAYSGKYASGHYRGTFVCICCDATLFNAQTKFESGTGWPSFYRPASDKAIQTAADYDGAEPRVEVMCRRCGAHLGHVFDDGPPPTGLRFCINSIAIKNKPPEGESTSGQSAGGTKSKTAAKSRTAAKGRANTASSSNSKSKSTAKKTTRSTGSDNSPASATTESNGNADSPHPSQPHRASDN